MSLQCTAAGTCVTSSSPGLPRLSRVLVWWWWWWWWWLWCVLMCVCCSLLVGRVQEGRGRRVKLTESAKGYTHARAHVWTSAVITVFDCCTPSLVRCCLSMSQGRQHLQDGRLCAWGAAEVECRALCRSATSSKSFVLNPPPPLPLPLFTSSPLNLFTASLSPPPFRLPIISLHRAEGDRLRLNLIRRQKDFDSDPAYWPAVS